MGNQGNNNNGQVQVQGTYNPNQFKPSALVDGLAKTAIPMNQTSVIFKEKTTVLQEKIADLIENTYGIAEIDHVGIRPTFGRDKSISGVICRAYFNTAGVTCGDIVRTGNGRSTSGVKTILQFTGNGIAGMGDFELSDHFKEIFAPLSIEPDGALVVRSVPDPRAKDVACLDLDAMSVLSLALAIGPNDPYNFSVISAITIDAKNGEYLLNIQKYIDTKVKKGRKNGTKIDYADLDRKWEDSNYYVGDQNRRAF